MLITYLLISVREACGHETFIKMLLDGFNEVACVQLHYILHFLVGVEGMLDTSQSRLGVILPLSQVLLLHDHSLHIFVTLSELLTEFIESIIDSFIKYLLVHLLSLRYIHQQILILNCKLNR